MVFIKRFIVNLAGLMTGITAGLLIAGVLLFLAVNISQNGTRGLIQNTSKLRAFVVLSGSMEPALPTGGIVVTTSVGEYMTGDIITFVAKEGSDPVTHRIVARELQTDGSYTFVTKGDANDDPDGITVTGDMILGKSVLFVPYVGRAAAFAKTPQGFIAMVVIPATIVIYEELRSLLQLGRGAIKKKLNQKSMNSSDKRQGLPKVLALFPAVGALMVLVAFTGSYFTDVEQSVGNVLSAASSFGTPAPSATPLPSSSPSPPPTANSVVINEVFADGRQQYEWVELYNNSDISVDVTGWKISDGDGWPNAEDDAFIETSIITPNGYAVVVGSTNSITQEDLPQGVILIRLQNANIGNQLNDNGDIVALKDSLGNVIDYVSYGTNTTYFSLPAPDEPDESLIRFPNGIDTDSFTDWQLTNNISLGTENN